MFDREVAMREGIWKAGNGGLNDADRDILANIYYESNAVYETGVGESTQIAIFTRVPRYTGVDNSIDWLKQVMALSPPHYRFHWADIGRVGRWSMPQRKSKIPKWPFSSTAALAAESEAFDFYFVDGRFRVASFAMAFLHARIHGRAATEFKVGVHDFARRSQQNYRDCYKIGTPIEGFGVNGSKAKLAIFRRKPGVSDEEIMEVWKQYQDDYE